jgi:hypothetical protein
MGLAVLALLMARTQRIRLRWGVTFTGLTLASGRAVYPAMAVVGALALVRGPVTGLTAAAVGGTVVFGLLGGGLYGLIPRRPRLAPVRMPTIRRVGVCGLVGAVTGPMFLAFGATPPMSPGAAGFVLLAGFAGMVCYLVAQYRRAEAAGATGAGVPAAAYR